jgi:hypothetical protein
MSEQLAKRIGEMRAESAAASPPRPQVDMVDAAIFMAAGGTAHHAPTSGAAVERRETLKALQPGASVIGRKVLAPATPRVSRATKVKRVKDWLSSLSPEQRESVDSDEWLERQSAAVRDVVMEASSELDLEEIESYVPPGDSGIHLEANEGVDAWLDGLDDDNEENEWN